MRPTAPTFLLQQELHAREAVVVVVRPSRVKMIAIDQSKDEGGQWKRPPEVTVRSVCL